MYLIKRIWGTIVRPRKTFEYLSHNPDWKAPFLLILIGWLFQIAVAIKVVKAMPVEEDIPKVAPIIVSGIGFTIYLISLYVAWGVRTALIYLLARIVRGKARFYSLFSAVGYAWIPFFISSLILTTIVPFIKIPADWFSYGGSSYSVGTSTMGLSLNLTLFFPNLEQTSPLFILLSHIDLFVVWSLALITLGIFYVFRFSLRKSIVVVASYWVLGIVWDIGRLFLGRWDLLKSLGI